MKTSKILLTAAIALIASTGCSWKGVEQKGHAAVDWTAGAAKSTITGVCRGGEWTTDKVACGAQAVGDVVASSWGWVTSSNEAVAATP